MKMNRFKCKMGLHDWKPVVRQCAPHDSAIWVPAGFGVVPIHYKSNRKTVGHQCKRCRKRVNGSGYPSNIIERLILWVIVSIPFVAIAAFGFILYIILIGIVKS